MALDQSKKLQSFVNFSGNGLELPILYDVKIHFSFILKLNSKFYVQSMVCVVCITRLF